MELGSKAYEQNSKEVINVSGVMNRTDVKRRASNPANSAKGGAKIVQEMTGSRQVTATCCINICPACITSGLDMNVSLIL